MDASTVVTIDALPPATIEPPPICKAAVIEDASHKLIVMADVYVDRYFAPSAPALFWQFNTWLVQLWDINEGVMKQCIVASQQLAHLNGVLGVLIVDEPLFLISQDDSFAVRGVADIKISEQGRLKQLDEFRLGPDTGKEAHAILIPPAKLNANQASILEAVNDGYDADLYIECVISVFTS